MDASRRPWESRVGDYNRDGKVDLFTTTFSDDYKTLYRNDGGGNFSDVTYQAGLGDPTVPFLAWGTGFLDFDNDGLPDIFIANGHVYPEVDKQDWGTTWAERPQLFPQSRWLQIQGSPARNRQRPGGCNHRPRCGFRRSV